MSSTREPNPLSLPIADTRGNGQPATLSDRVRSLRLPDRPVRGSGGSSALPWLLCLVLAGTTSFLGYLVWANDRPSERPTSPQGDGISTTDDAGGGAPRSRNAVESGGFIIPTIRVKVSPKVGGQILKLFYVEGQKVKEGEKLAIIDPTKYDYAYKRLKAAEEVAKADWDRAQNGSRPEEIDQAEFRLHEVRAQSRRSTEDFERSRSGGEAITREEREQRKRQMEQDSALVKQMEFALTLMQKGPREEDRRRAKSNWENACHMAADAKYDLDNTLVLAPSDGTILTKNFEEGNLFRPESFDQSGKPASVYEMADLKKLEVDTDVSERDIVDVFKGQKCEVRPEAAPGKVYPGVVSRIMPEALRSKASVSVRVAIVGLTDDEKIIRPEMRARVSFLPESKVGDKELAPAPAK
jgi:HlyD family secretion protein